MHVSAPSRRCFSCSIITDSRSNSFALVKWGSLLSMQLRHDYKCGNCWPTCLTKSLANVLALLQWETAWNGGPCAGSIFGIQSVNVETQMYLTIRTTKQSCFTNERFGYFNSFQNTWFSTSAHQNRIMVLRVIAMTLSMPILRTSSILKYGILRSLMNLLKKSASWELVLLQLGGLKGSTYSSGVSTSRSPM